MSTIKRIALGGGVLLALVLIYGVTQYAPFMATVKTPFDPQPAIASDTGNVKVGDRYIDFTATNSDGESFTLSSLEGKPVLLKFYRAHW